MQNSLKRMWALLGVVAAIAAVAATQAVAAHKAGPTIVIWTDSDRAAAVTKVANDWAGSSGATIKVVTKNFGDIRDNLGTVAAADAPDVITAAHDWTGKLAASGLVAPIFLNAATTKNFPSYTLNAFSYGTAVKKLYGVPVAVENIGLVVNTKLAKVPTSFAQLEQEALAVKKAKHQTFGIAVQQGSGGDAYHMYPFFSGLGGYVFGTSKAGTLNPKDIGVASPTLMKNAKLIDKWNKEGLISSKVDGGAAQNAFLKGQAAFWVTGPWNADTLRKSGLSFKVIQVPAIAKAAVPFLGVQGFMVTRFAAGHGVSSLAKDLVGAYIARAASQKALAAANNRFPANIVAGKQVNDSLLAQFGRAGKGGVPMPNIPQMASVWEETNAAWLKSTKGAGATPARTAFATAARNIANKIASG
jgi:arabinogalactan oligomer / maltooligosaccharide transport system substrate-binding protein